MLRTAEQIKQMALEAFARGWIKERTLWDIACLLTEEKHTATPEKVLGSFLSLQQLREIGYHTPQEKTLAAKPSSQTLAMEGLEKTLESAEVEKTQIQHVQEKKSSGSGKKSTRYALGEELGSGGVGQVVSALDQSIGRTVALKTLQPEFSSDQDVLERFLTEAEVTAKLEHPSVIPVYDLGKLNSGEPFYTMRIVKRRSLSEVLGKPSTHRTSFSLSRLCSIFVQVCRAMAYAHARGVVHRDLKPHNILLGDYGEVYVADWGIAKLLEVSESQRSLKPIGMRSTSSTQMGAFLGTPGYMSPEQARGEGAWVDHRADLFSLGVILYEIVTGCRPFDASTTVEILRSTLECSPKQPRELLSSCPLVLEDLCLKLLSKHPSERPESAEVVAAEVEAFLEGAKEKERRREEAKRLAEQAKVPAESYQKLEKERKHLLLEAKQYLKAVKDWDAIEKKRPGWLLEDRAKTAEAEQAKALADAVELYSQALGYDPECQEARTGLAELYWHKAQEAETNQEPATQIFYESLVLDYDTGRYHTLLAAESSISLRSTPPGAQVIAYRYIEKDRVLCPSERKQLGKTPLENIQLPPGSYLFVLQHPGFEDVSYPVLLSRGATHDGLVNLYTQKEIGKEFLYIPAGSFLLGGDEEAYDPLPRQQCFLEDFAISRFALTFGEYLAFINDRWKKDPDNTARRLPRQLEGDSFYVIQDQTGAWIPHYERLLQGEGKRFCPKDRVNALAVGAVDWFDALAYCRWRSERDGVTYRLPTEAEYEKASRGVDGRFFPWGDNFDPTFCKMRSSRPGLAQPEPVGSFQKDQSPYGVRDLSGNTRFWCSNIHGTLDAQTAAKEPEPKEGTLREETGVRLARGGTWLGSIGSSRAASRSQNFAMTRFISLGIRLAKTLSKK